MLPTTLKNESAAPIWGYQWGYPQSFSSVNVELEVVSEAYLATVRSAIVLRLPAGLINTHFCTQALPAIHIFTA